MQHEVLVLEENAGVTEYWSIGSPRMSITPLPHYPLLHYPLLHYSAIPCCSLEKRVHQACGILNDSL
jgi:hypothetical protein